MEEMAGLRWLKLMLAFFLAAEDTLAAVQSRNLICVQMAGLYWMAVTLAFFLSAGNTLAAVDKNRLKDIVQGIYERQQATLSSPF
ncbi:hypothetical protein PAMP_021541 [Pampus punctatissimus]